MLESMEDIEEQSVDMDDMLLELSIDDIEEQSIDEDGIELSIVELDDCARPGTVAAARAPATSNAAVIASSFFILSSLWWLLARGQYLAERTVPACKVKAKKCLAGGTAGSL